MELEGVTQQVIFSITLFNCSDLAANFASNTSGPWEGIRAGHMAPIFVPYVTNLERQLL